MKKLLAFFILGTALTGCGSATVTPIFYSATGSAPHYSSGTQTHFGLVQVWNANVNVSTNDVGFITSSDAIHDATHDGTATKYLLVVPRRLNYSVQPGNTIDNFDLTHGTSLPDTDARALFATLKAIASAPPKDSSYFHYSCDEQLNIAPRTVTPTRYGNSVSTGVASEATWVTTCELTYYLGIGTLTLADGTAWTESLPLDSGAISRMIPILQGAISDLESQR